MFLFVSNYFAGSRKMTTFVSTPQWNYAYNLSYCFPIIAINIEFPHTLLTETVWPFSHL